MRLKDRLQEDSRLQQMSIAAPNVSSSSSELQCPPPLCPPSQQPLPPSPHRYPQTSPVQSHNIEILDGSHPPSTPSQLLLQPSAHAIPSPALSTESHDIEILDSSQAYICPYKYHPVNEEWQRVTCENMGLIYCGSNRTAPGGLHIPLMVPASVRSIKGDGNCFFQSISYIITGSEEQHEFVRRAILIHMRAFGHFLFLWLNGRTIDNVEEYIQLSGMEKDGTWATDVEVFALSHLFGICLYTFDERYSKWSRYSPCNIDNMITESNLCEMGIYLNHPRNHYEVATSVTSRSI